MKGKKQMYYSNIAKEIDEEYKLKQKFKNKQRQTCNDKKCTKCVYQNICEESERKNEV